MARQFPGATTTDRLAIPASTAFDFNSNVCLWAILYIDAYAVANSHVITVGTTGRGFGLYYTNAGLLSFLKTAVAGISGTATTTVSTGRWYALQAYATAGGAAKLKRYDYAAGTLATETVANAGTINTPSNDPGIVGNFVTLGGNQAFDGRIDRVAILQADPSDGEFLQFAYGRWPAQSFKLFSIFRGFGTEADWSGNQLNLAVTGTTAADGAPVSLWSPGRMAASQILIEAAAGAATLAKFEGFRRNVGRLMR